MEKWFYDGWLGGNPAVIDRLFAPEIVTHFPHGRARGVAPLRAVALELQALDELTGYLAVRSTGGQQAASFTIHGVQTRPYFSRAPTGDLLEIAGTITARMHFGRIVELWQTGGCTVMDAAARGSRASDLSSWAQRWQLTPRETEVAGLVMRGYPDKAIAVDLELATASVNRHVRKILRKSRARSRTELAERAGVLRIG